MCSEEAERLPPARQVHRRHSVHRLVELAVEVVDPELVEVAQHRVPGPVRHRQEPVVEGLAVVLAQVGAGLHLHQHPGLPHQVREAGAPVVPLLDPQLQLGAGLGAPLVAERPEEAVEEHLRLALPIPAQVIGAVGHQALQPDHQVLVVDAPAPQTRPAAPPRRGAHAPASLRSVKAVGAQVAVESPDASEFLPWAGSPYAGTPRRSRWLSRTVSPWMFSPCSAMYARSSSAMQDA